MLGVKKRGNNSDYRYWVTYLAHVASRVRATNFNLFELQISLRKISPEKTF